VIFSSLLEKIHRGWCLRFVYVSVMPKEFMIDLLCYTPEKFFAIMLPLRSDFMDLLKK